MPQSFFIWNGVDCRAMGITMRGPAPIIRAEERVNHVAIQGRSGDLTETEGENIYNSYIQTVSISVRGGIRVNDVYRWLRGSGYVTFSGEPDRKQAARVIGAITLNKISRNMDRWAGEVQFYCQPLKERITETAETVTATNTVVRNGGDVICKPLYKVTASAARIRVTVVGANTPAENSLLVEDLHSGDVIWIDADSMEVWNADRSATITAQSSGEFPVMSEGTNVINITNISSVEIQKRERFL